MLAFSATKAVGLVKKMGHHTLLTHQTYSKLVVSLW